MAQKKGKDTLVPEAHLVQLCGLSVSTRCPRRSAERFRDLLLQTYFPHRVFPSRRFHQEEKLFVYAPTSSTIPRHPHPLNSPTTRNYLTSHSNAPNSSIIPASTFSTPPPPPLPMAHVLDMKIKRATGKPCSSQFVFVLILRFKQAVNMDTPCFQSCVFVVGTQIKQAKSKIVKPWGLTFCAAREDRTIFFPAAM